MLKNSKNQVRKIKKRGVSKNKKRGVSKNLITISELFINPWNFKSRLNT